MRPDGRTLVSAPAVEPVTLANVLVHLREDNGAQDDLISNSMIPAARRYVEARTWRALVTQTWDFTWRRFPTCREIAVPMPPLQSVTSVSYYDTDNASQTLSSSKYFVDTSEQPGIIRLIETETWPETYYGRPAAVTVRAIVGFGDAGTDVPENYLQAMYLLIGHWYENRESVVVGTTSAVLQQTVDALLALDHARAMIG